MKKQALKKEFSKEELDNRSKQLNPNNIEYLKSRGICIESNSSINLKDKNGRVTL